MLERGAAAHAQGGERRRPRVPRADAAGRLSRSSAAFDEVEGPPGALGAVDLVQPRAGSRAERTSSSTSSRRRSPTRACRSRSASTLHERVGELHRGDRSRRDRPPSRPARAPLLAQREPAEEARVPRPRRRCRAGGVRERGGDRLLRAAGAARRGRERVDVLLKLGKVLELVGDWQRAEEVDERGAGARRRPRRRRQRRASCETALAEVARKQGRFDEALERLDRAARGFEAAGRRGRRRAGAAPGRHARRAARRLRRRPSRTTRRASRSASASATRRAWAACCPTSASSPSTAATTSARARLHERALRAAHRDRRPLGDRQLDEQPRHDRACCRSSSPRRATGSGSRCCSTAKSATPGWSRCATTTSATPRAASATTTRRAATTRQPAARTATTTTLGARVPARGRGHAGRAGARAPAALELVGAADALREAIGAPRAPSREEEIAKHLSPRRPRSPTTSGSATARAAML